MENKRSVAVIQSNYIPWKGYFDIIHDVDLFIFHDDLQYTKNDWRNRNRVYAPDGPKWLAIPVGTDEKRLILDVRFENNKWQKDHYNKICSYYKKAPFFSQYEYFIREVYLEREWDYLYELNRFIIKRISNEFLGIETQFEDSRSFITQGTKQDKLLSMLVSAKANTYISGPAAKEYIIEPEFQKAEIHIVWKNYDGYPEYPQMHNQFYHNLSILDLLFNVGDCAANYIWGWRD